MAEHLRLVLELPLPLSPQARREITDAPSAYSHECWTYVMIGREASRIILQRIVADARPGVTLAVWEAARLCSAYGTGEIEASRAELAALAGTNEREVSRALSRLAEIGALVRIDRGRYALHPDTAWSGSKLSRETARTMLTVAD